ncbi:MAG TPA: hypothetical protein VGA78_13355 [Gemmatimonadales bacterium]
MRALVALLLLVPGASGAGAQSSPPSRDTTPAGTGGPIATLAAWADEVWLTLLDRDGSYFGRLAEQGTFQRFNRLMDHEYELDLATGLFTGSETARWAPVRSGFRAAGASISHPLLLNVAEWRHDIPVAGPVAFVPRFLRQHSLSTRRDYLEVAVEWRDLGPLRALRGGFGVHAFKASGDLELGVQLGSSAGSPGLSAGFRLALVDAFTNPVFSLAGRDPAQADTHYHYQAKPAAARLDLTWIYQNFRLELFGGASTRSRVQVTFPNTGDPSFTQSEDFRFGGALVEVAPCHHRFEIVQNHRVKLHTPSLVLAGSCPARSPLHVASPLGGGVSVRMGATGALETLAGSGPLEGRHRPAAGREPRRHLPLDSHRPAGA